MKIKIICVGKIKENFYKDAILEYSKRLSRYCILEVVEVEDEKTPDKASENECSLIKKKEGQRILSHIKDNEFIVTLEIEGKKLTSPGLAKKLEEITVLGNSTLDFIIGGSLGLSDEIKNKADFKLSFSDMTFPHQLMRVILLEQIYRAFKINNNEPYHK